MDISLCLCTFRRPALLDTLLADLARQDRLGLTCELIVVDNDPQQSAASVLDTWRATFPFELRPLHVPEPNIALARNAAVQAARGEFIVFIDDDEQPSDAWLAQLIQTQRSSQADVVIGPVEGRLPPDAPDWMARGGFFAAPSMPTGTRLRYTQAYSGNCLLRAAMLARLKGPFDPAFGVTGGSDTMLFRDAELAGATIIWSEEARVSEEVPPAAPTCDGSCAGAIVADKASSAPTSRGAGDGTAQAEPSGSACAPRRNCSSRARSPWPACPSPRRAASAGCARHARNWASWERWRATGISNTRCEESAPDACLAPPLRHRHRSPWEKGLLAAFIVVSLAFPFIRTIDFLANNTLADASFSEGSIWLQAVFGPLFLLAAIQAWHHGRWTFRVLRTANPFLLAVIAWAALTVLWSPYPEVTVKRSIQQMGLVLIGLSLTLPFVSHDFFARVLHRALIALLIVSFIVVLLFPSVGIDRLREGGWHGILWHKNTLGVVACFATVLGVYRIARNDGDRRGQLALLVFALFMLVMSRSSTALLSGLLGSGFFLFLRKPYLGGRYALPQIGLVLGIAVALVLLLAFLALGRLPGWDDLAAPCFPSSTKART